MIEHRELRTITFDELTEQIDTILDAVEKGQEFLVTSNGSPFATLRPVDPPTRSER